MAIKQKFTNNFLDYLESIQENIKYILSFIIITNFIIIFLIKFAIRAREKFKNFFQTNESTKQEVLLIIAHPDDEIMFFYPTLINFIKNKIKIRILCLSNGNFDGIGQIRQGEFSQVMKMLKIEDYKIINDERLNDGIKVKWDESYIAARIKQYLSEEEGDSNSKIINFNKIGTIITFDENGVTKHPNHSSCCHGLL